MRSCSSQPPGITTSTCLVNQGCPALASLTQSPLLLGLGRAGRIWKAGGRAVLSLCFQEGIRTESWTNPASCYTGSLPAHTPGPSTCSSERLMAGRSQLEEIC